MTRACRVEVLRELATLADSGIDMTGDTLRVMADVYENGTASVSPFDDGKDRVDESWIVPAALADIKNHAGITYAYLLERNYDAILAQLDYMRERCSWIESEMWRRITPATGQPEQPA